ncbi:MAG: nucleotidyltransferase family protein [Chromatiales bacterium]|nr:nucleotidyltransferase family protein [Chromatiales bacterium]
MQALSVIDRSGLRIGLVADSTGHLLGVVTDGDVRRGILKGIGTDQSVERIMSTRPSLATADEPREQVLARMRARRLNHIPLVDENGVLVGLETLDDLLRGETRPNLVVLMAGGLGSRLRPLTEELPKPLLKVGSRPLLEIILEGFLEQGFHRFHMAVNYKSQMIKEYFGDGSRWGATINYLEERQRLGTAGALALLPERPEEPFFVMNGDLMTRAHFQHLLEFHQRNNAQATLCVREYEQEIPYGVVRLEQQRLFALEEKPVQRFLVNSGIYVLDPSVLPLIPKDRAFDMPDLFRTLIAKGETTVAFPLHEYWLDIGRVEDFERAGREYAEVFAG